MDRIGKVFMVGLTIGVVCILLWTLLAGCINICGRSTYIVNVAEGNSHIDANTNVSITGGGSAVLTNPPSPEPTSQPVSAKP